MKPARAQPTIRTELEAIEHEMRGWDEAVKVRTAAKIIEWADRLAALRARD